MKSYFGMIFDKVYDGFFGDEKKPQQKTYESEPEPEQKKVMSMDQTVASFASHKSRENSESSRRLEDHKKEQAMYEIEFEKAVKDNDLDYKWSNGYVFEAIKSGFNLQFVHQDSRIIVHVSRIPENETEREMIRDAGILEHSDPGLYEAIKTNMQMTDVMLDNVSLIEAVRISVGFIPAGATV